MVYTPLKVQKYRIFLRWFSRSGNHASCKFLWVVQPFVLGVWILYLFIYSMDLVIQISEVSNCNLFGSCTFHQFNRIKQQCTFLHERPVTYTLAIFNPTFTIFLDQKINFSRELLVVGVQLSDWFDTLQYYCYYCFLSSASKSILHEVENIYIHYST